MSTIIDKKKEQLIKRIKETQNIDYINDMLRLSPESTFDFDKEWGKGYTSNQMREITIKHLESLPWKK